MWISGAGLAASGLWRYLAPIVVAPAYFNRSGSRWIDAQRSDRTREEYAAWLEKFVRFVGKFPDEITGADGQAWVNWLKEHGGRDGEGHKEASINAAVAAVSSFYNFAG